MAYFTPQEASSSTITRCEARFSDSAQTQHMYYVFGVEDDNGVKYVWKDHDLEAGASTEVIKSAIYNHLISSVDKKSPKTESTMQDEGIIGSNPNA